MTATAAGAGAGGQGTTEERDARRQLRELVRTRSVVVCGGSGGVGKTTIAAVLALQAATDGRRVVVLTIDPARRLADALGLDALDNEPHPVDAALPGALHAAMLDTRATFDTLVGRYAAAPGQAQAILANRFYRNISHSLSGTQEYMAAEKLYELHTSGRFDLVVVDTPPTRQALDFLDAPAQLARFLDHRVYRLMTGSGGGVNRVVSRASRTVLRTAGRLVGASVMDDAVAFFAAFGGMEAGFRARSQQVRALLRSPETAFAVVASPSPDTVHEAVHFVDRLRGEGVSTAALVANRMTPRFAAIDVAVEAARTDRPQDPPPSLALLADLTGNLAELRATADAEATVLARLAAAAPGAPLVEVPALEADVHDLDGLEALRTAVFGAAGG